MDVLRVIYNSMGDTDILVYTRKPDTRAARRYFDFNPDKTTTTLSPIYSFVLNLLGIDRSLYDVEMGFNEDTRMRYVRIRLKASLSICFKFEDSEQEVKLEKGDTILLLRVWHQTVLELISQFDGVGFNLLHSSLTKDKEYLLTVSGIVPDSSETN